MEGLPFSQVCAFPAQTEKMAILQENRFIKTAILHIVQLFPPARQAIPAQLNKNASRYQVSGVLEKERANSVLELIAEMKDSKTVVAAYHADDPNAGMANHASLDNFFEKKFRTDPGKVSGVYEGSAEGWRYSDAAGLYGSVFVKNTPAASHLSPKKSHHAKKK